ncbi:MAG TPA: TlpA disulfide reductase family protein [Anaerolineales bacterium]|nr:TlpA disulfide reductase family protein [Anaerolineales bacterium]
MEKKTHRRRKPKQNPVVPIATGFLFIGMALIWLALPNARNKTGAENGSLAGSSLPVSFPAPELTLETLHGKAESLADYQESVVLVNNWATWCPPCKAEMPVLNTYYQDHAGEGFMVIAVEAGDDRETVLQFVNDYQLSFQVWLDPSTASLKAFGNSNLPNSYVIDRKGMVRYAWTGQVTRSMLERYVTPLLAE